MYVLGLCVCFYVFVCKCFPIAELLGFSFEPKSIVAKFFLFLNIVIIRLILLLAGEINSLKASFESSSNKRVWFFFSVSGSHVECWMSERVFFLLENVVESCRTLQTTSSFVKLHTSRWTVLNNFGCAPLFVYCCLLTDAISFWVVGLVLRNLLLTKTNNLLDCRYFFFFFFGYHRNSTKYDSHFC